MRAAVGPGLLRRCAGRTSRAILTIFRDSADPAAGGGGDRAAPSLDGSHVPCSRRFMEPASQRAASEYDALLMNCLSGRARLKDRFSDSRESESGDQFSRYLLVRCDHSVTSARVILRQFAFVHVRSGFVLFLPRSRKTAEILRLFNGAGEGIRTLDPDLGKVVLYP